MSYNDLDREEQMRLRRLMCMGRRVIDEEGRSVYVLDSSTLRTYAELGMSICLTNSEEAYLYDPEVYDELTPVEGDE